jgi:small subunit ribosomal protein S3
LRSDIDYAVAEAATQYGRLGVKVWICRGEVLPGEMVKEPEAPKQRPRRNRRGRRFNNPRQGQQNRAPRNEQAAAAPAEKGGNE